MLSGNEQVLDHAQRIADLAAKAARGYFRNLLDVEMKADESPVTQADKGVEKKVRAYLAEHFPQDGILGEEFANTESESGYTWSVDPIDGTRSFLSGHPLFGFLLARLFNDTPEIGVIGMPALGETIIGQKGKGATLNGEAIHVSKQPSLDHAILFINEGEKIHATHPAVFAKLMLSGQTRRFAYDCYPHALVAMGHVDGVVDFDLQPYDYLPIVTVVEAAGGVVSDWAGRTLSLRSGTCAIVSAATPELHAKLLKKLDV